MRKPWQGVSNIVRFNYPFYLLASVLLLCCVLLVGTFPIFKWIAITIALPTAVSLLVSAYVYDLSDLYDLPFLRRRAGARIMVINAGLDEIRPILRERFQGAEINVLDFYDPARHTESSIRRARRAYPPGGEVINVSTNYLPFGTGRVDTVILFMSAHEIRDEKECTDFFRECRRVLSPNGRIYLTEHLRDGWNFAAYTVGFLHFRSSSSWHRIIYAAGLTITKRYKTTPFVTTYVLSR